MLLKNGPRVEDAIEDARALESDSMGLLPVRALIDQMHVYFETGVEAIEDEERGVRGEVGRTLWYEVISKY